MQFIMTFMVFLVFFAVMALGIFLGRRPIQGSCAGLANVGIEKSCDCEVTCDEHNALYQIQEPTQKYNH
ncbi:MULTISPECIES: (Na+)-NQR maturation NqrM [Shewanella]|uniref:(Na+)-NQR maturation NqrM n=1 Tax=Shewanella metallivivens TaxID=2872342 RepID=A0ABT5TKE0_9GAMM|nr:(Na+)-NQR maturation NqrM [Shewanella metallivivens]MDD8059062.1 (Na+)-NQR maturation NqrM [Shewanella metallivivens]